jgi:hypothetical protein
MTWKWPGPKLGCRDISGALLPSVGLKSKLSKKPVRSMCFSFSLTMEAECSSKLSVDFCWTTYMVYVPEDSTLQGVTSCLFTCCHNNPISHDYNLLGYDVMQFNRQAPTFCRNLLLPAVYLPIHWDLST